MPWTISLNLNVIVNYYILIIQEKNINLHCKLQTVFNKFSTLYGMNYHIRNFLREKFAYLCDFCLFVHPKHSDQIYIFAIFLVYLAVQFG